MYQVLGCVLGGYKVPVSAETMGKEKEQQGEKQRRPRPQDWMGV